MHVSWTTQTASLAGALLILAACMGRQLRWMDSRQFFYKLAHPVDAAILAWIARPARRTAAAG